YYGNQRQLEYDLVVAPGVDSAAIGLGFDGADSVEIEGNGALAIGIAGGGVVRLHAPRAYQAVGGAQKEVASRYVARNLHASADGGALPTVGIEVGEYDRSLSLVIDPILAYSTYLGGTSLDIGRGIAVDGTGSAYVTGETASLDFPTAGAG